MTAVVFLRGVNVGGKRTFRPAALATVLSDLDVVSIGAAGTFVVRRSVSRTALRAEFRGRLPFEAELMICGARDVTDLVADDAFPPARLDAGVRPFVSVLARRPSRTPPLPLVRPAGKPWEVKVVAVRGPFALSLSRRTGKPTVYPNEVVEKDLGLAATTRGWDTILKIHSVLEGR